MPNATLDPQAQADLAKFRQEQAAVNKQFLHYALKKPVAGATPNGTSFSNSGPTSLKFQISGINGGWLREVRVVTQGSFTYTAATTAPTQSINAVGLDAIYSTVKIKYGSSYNPAVPPIYFRLLQQSMGYGRLPFNVEPSVSQDVAAIQASIGSQESNFAPGGTLSAGTNNFTHVMDIPLQVLHPSHPSGILPIDTTGTVFSLELVPNINGLVGKDPLDNFCNTNGTVTFGTCNVKVTFFYSDGETLTYTQMLQPNMQAMPSAEYAAVTDQPLVANQLVVQQLQLALPLARIFTIVIDGNSSSQFCTLPTPTNEGQGIQQFAYLKGSNKSDTFVSFDSGNGGVENYLINHRKRYGTDLPAGVFLYDAMAHNTTNPSNQQGLAFWDTSSGVWAASRVGVNVATVGTNGNPRISTLAIVQNPAGIIK